MSELSPSHSHRNFFDEDKFLTEFIQNQLQQTFPMDSSLSYEEYSSLDLKSNNSSNSNISHQDASNSISHTRVESSSSSSSFMLSFENSTMEKAHHGHSSNDSPQQFSSSKKSTSHNNNHGIKPKGAKELGNKKFRSSSEIKDHIMAERKRRQELTQRFIALSATIPGLKKTGKAYILREAINYVKQLQDRVKELENHQSKRETTTDSVIFIKKSQVCTIDAETSYDRSSTMALPHVEARVLENEVLIGIHCEKENDVVLRIMTLLQNLHLSLVSSSVLPFGPSTLKVTVIAQKGDKYCMTVNDLVKNLKQDLFKSMTNIP